MTDTTTDSILFALYCLCRDNKHVDATELALAASVSPTLAAQTLVQLERAGLVDASRARLTMLGLARACQLQASGQGGPRVSLGQSRPRVQKTALPVAAKSQVPPAPKAPERTRVRMPEVVAYLQGHA
jgi:hypothetical protein